jgi:hypothetical protein
MSIATGASPIKPEPGLLGQTVVVIGGSAGIGLETARRAAAAPWLGFPNSSAETAPSRCS